MPPAADRQPEPPPESGVESPCNLVCTIDRVTGLCLGCARTLDEIAIWGVASNDERRSILRAVAERKTV